MKYSSYFLIVSICVFTVLCVSAASAPAVSIKADEDVDYFNGDLAVFFKAFSDFSGSQNGFVKLLREQVTQCLASFDENKKEVQEAVKEGTEMEKKIQDISSTLKNVTTPLPKDIQTELDTIVKTAAAELTKLKGLNKVDDIDAMKKKFTDHYEKIKTKMETYYKMAATAPPISTTNPATPMTKEKVTEMEGKLFEFIQTMLPALRFLETDDDAISVKLRDVYSTLSKIRNELIKVERIQFHLIQSQNFKKDAAPAVCSPLAQFAIAIMFGMLF